MNADHDDEPSFIPGVYMMSTKEAIAAGFISYDKPTSPPDAMTDVEKLIERLEYISEPSPYRRARNGVVSVLLKEAATMLRSQQAKLEMVEAQRKELELELWKWPALMNEVRAKLERAREALEWYAENYNDDAKMCATLEELK